MPELLLRFCTHLLIPALFGLWLAQTSGKSRTRWAIDLGVFWSYVVLLFLAGSWALLAYPLRYLPPLALVAGTIWGARRLSALPPRPSSWARPAALGGLGLVLGFAALQAVLAQATPEPTLPLSFPLRDGTYCTLEGGGHQWVNRHATVDSVRAAVEVVKLGAGGRIDQTTVPFVFSPLSGSVVDLSGGVIRIAGSASGQARAEEVATSELRSGNVVVSIWPITEVTVGVGDRVGPEDRLGRVAPGPEGHRSLAVAASLDGRPVPIRFDGYYLPRNALFRAPKSPDRPRN